MRRFHPPQVRPAPALRMRTAPRSGLDCRPERSTLVWWRSARRGWATNERCWIGLQPRRPRNLRMVLLDWSGNGLEGQVLRVPTRVRVVGSNLIPPPNDGTGQGLDRWRNRWVPRRRSDSHWALPFGLAVQRQKPRDMSALRYLANTVPEGSDGQPLVFYDRTASTRNKSHRPYRIFLRMKYD